MIRAEAADAPKHKAKRIQLGGDLRWETAHPLICKSTYYAFTIDPEVRGFVRSLNKETVGKIVNFGSAAMLNSTYKKVEAEADKAGVPMDPREFHCRGEFKGLHKGRPNDDDLKAAEAFAKAICAD